MAISAKTWARIGTAAFVALAVAVSVLGLHTERQAPVALATPTAPGSAAADPLAAELYLCQALGQPGASDPDCLRAWAENRRRFLAPGALPEAKLPASSMTPTAPSAAPAPAQSRVGQP